MFPRTGVDARSDADTRITCKHRTKKNKKLDTENTVIIILL